MLVTNNIYYICVVIKKIIFTLFCFSFYCFFAQNSSLLTLKREKLQNELTTMKTDAVVKKKRGIGNALLNVYQKHISVLISAECLYSLSCSRYSREALNKYGFFPGILLSADRITRCSFFCSKDIPDSKFNDDGLVQDNP